MSTASKLISFSVAASGGGGGGLSSLATLINGMTSGTWSTWTGGVLSNTLTNPQADDPVTSNGSVCNWDAVNKLIMYYGHGHGNDYQSLQLDYQDANNQWINTSGVPIGSGISFPTHQFCGQTANSANGDLYWFYQNGHVFKRAGGASVWTDLGALPQGNHGQGCGAAFLPQYGTKGGAVFASCYGIDVWDEGTQSWTELSNGSGLALGDSSQLRQCLGFYDVAAHAVFFVSVVGANDKTVYRVASSGAITKMGNAPISVNCNIASPGLGMVVDGYTSASTLSTHNTTGTVRNPCIMRPASGGSGIWEYTSSSDTWAQTSTATTPDSTIADYGMFIGCCLTYDCLIYAAETSSNGTCTLSVYRR